VGRIAASSNNILAKCREPASIMEEGKKSCANKKTHPHQEQRAVEIAVNVTGIIDRPTTVEQQKSQQTVDKKKKPRLHGTWVPPVLQVSYCEQARKHKIKTLTSSSLVLIDRKHEISSSLRLVA
jgi:hypothetical protein